MKRITTIAMLGLAFALSVGCGGGGQDKRLNGGGSTFVYPMMSKWADEYDKAKGVEVNYQSIGSGGGIQQMTAKTFDFGCTDGPMNDEQLEEGDGDRRRGRPHPARHGRRRAGLQPRGGQGAAPASPARCWPTSTWARSRSGTTTAIKDLNPKVQAAARPGHRRRPPLRRQRHHLHLGRLPLQGQPGVEGEGRRRHVGQLAGRHRPEGQRRRGRPGPRSPGTIGYVELIYAFAERHEVRPGARTRRASSSRPTLESVTAAAADNR